MPKINGEENQQRNRTTTHMPRQGIEQEEDEDAHNEY
jgi:hypothetical protein